MTAAAVVGVEALDLGEHVQVARGELVRMLVRAFDDHRDGPAAVLIIRLSDVGVVVVGGLVLQAPQREILDRVLVDRCLEDVVQLHQELRRLTAVLAALARGQLVGLLDGLLGLGGELVGPGGRLAGEERTGEEERDETHLGTSP